MGLFDKLFKKGINFTSPLEGELVDLKNVPDPTFSDEMLGKGVAIKPTKGEVYAPCDARVVYIGETKHAISLAGTNNTEILIHVGLDTVKLNGEGFEVLVKDGDEVKQGQLLMKVDLNKIKESGYDTITPFVICNSADYKKVEGIKTGRTVTKSDEVLHLE